jgi:predicted acylesterase/phospholipase RssA
MGDEPIHEYAAGDHDPPDDQDAKSGILRLAVAMRGGVSLAVWIGGAMAEIDRLRRAKGTASDVGKPDPFAKSLLDLTRFGTVEVDVLSGASAGGLNAAIAATAFASGAEVELKQVWLDVADIDRLLHHGEAPTGLAHRRSVLNGDYFLTEVTRLLRRIVESGNKDRRTSVHAFLAATVFDGMTVTNRLDPMFHDRRSEACFHLRHTAPYQAFSHFMRPDTPERVGIAARASASFPAAFEPVSVDLKTALGTLQLPPAPLNQGVTAPGHVRLYDGGIVDNIPVARAIRATTEVASDQPVRRWVVFLHPSPDLDGPARPPAVPTIAHVIKDFLGAAGQETLLDDLDVLAAHNRDVEAYNVQSYTLCTDALSAAPSGPRNALPSIDAMHIYELLDEPAVHLTYVPIDQDPPPSPIALLGDEARFTLRMSLLEGALEPQSPPLRPFAALVRTAYFLIEWIRWLERNEVPIEPATRSKVYDILQLSQLIDASLDRYVIDHVNEPIVDVLRDEIRRIDTLDSIVDLVGLTGSFPRTNSARHAATPDRLSGDLLDTLAALAGGKIPPGHASANEPGVVEQLRRQQAEIAFRLFSRKPSTEQDRSVFTLVNKALLDRAIQVGVIVDGEVRVVTEEHAVDVLDVLDRMDRGQAGLHGGRAVGIPRALDYLRISGARSSPLSDPDFLREVGLHFSATGGLLQRDDGAIDPAKKLSGNTLGNFSAFFARRFRANDWMWGRMDAASGLVEILLRGEHLAEGGDDRIEKLTNLAGALLAPDDSHEDNRLKELFDDLWCRYKPVVENEIVQATSGGQTTLPITKGLVTLRWQLQIMLDELGDVFAARLEPDRPGEQFQFPPPSSAAAVDESATIAAAVPLKRMLTQYEELPRNVRDLWGRRRSTALGVKVVRHVTAALYPERGILQKFRRVLVGTPLLVAVACLIQPATSMFALDAIMNLVVFPTLSGVGRWIAVIVSLVVSLAFHRFVVRRAHPKTQWWGALVVVLFHAVPIVGVWIHHLVPLDRPRPILSVTPLSLFRGPFFHDGAHGVGVAVLVAVVVTFGGALALWSWAKLFPRFIVATLSAAVMGWWTIIASWQTTSRPSSWLWRLQRQLSPMWVPAIVLLALTSMYAIFVGHPENRPENPLPSPDESQPSAAKNQAPAPSGTAPCKTATESTAPATADPGHRTDEGPCKQAAAKPQPSFDVAVLAVHGIGTQSKGSTLREFADSIVGLLRSLTHAADPARKVDFTLVEDPEGGDDDGFVRLSVPMLSPPLERRQRWIIGEGWWADAFDAPDRGESSRWLVDAGPFFAYYFAVRLWRRFRVGWAGVAVGLATAGAASWLVAAAATERGLKWPGIAGAVALLALAVSLVTPVRLGAVIVAATLMIIFPVAAVVTVAIVVLYVVGLLPGNWTKKVRALQVTLSRSVGDSSALISSRRREAAMLEAVLAATERLTAAADGAAGERKPLVIAAHSQGASLVYRLFKRPEFRNALRCRRVTLLTYGAAIHPLELLEERIGDGSRPFRGRAQGVIGLLGFALFLVPLDRFAMNSANLTAMICLAASLVLATVSFVMVKVSTSSSDGTARRIVPGHPTVVPTVDLGTESPLDQRFRWVDFWAPWDPVPNGPLDLGIRPTPIEPSDPGVATDGRAVPCRVSNEHQPWRDHVVYRLDVEDVVSRWLAEIAAAGGASSADARAFSDLPTRDCPRWTAAQARRFRLRRGQLLFSTQLVLFAAAFVAVDRRWRDLPALGRWMKRHAPNFVHTAVSGVANAIPTQVRKYLGASADHTAHLYGLLAAASAFGIAVLVLAFVMAQWNSRPANLFANASVDKRIGAPWRGVVTCVVFAAVIAGAIILGQM